MDVHTNTGGAQGLLRRREFEATVGSVKPNKKRMQFEVVPHAHEDSVPQ